MRWDCAENCLVGRIPFLASFFSGITTKEERALTTGLLKWNASRKPVEYNALGSATVLRKDNVRGSGTRIVYCFTLF